MTDGERRDMSGINKKIMVGVSTAVIVGVLATAISAIKSQIVFAEDLERSQEPIKIDIAQMKSDIASNTVVINSTYETIIEIRIDDLQDDIRTLETQRPLSTTDQYRLSNYRDKLDKEQRKMGHH